MRRLLAMALVIVALPLVLVFGLGASNGGGSGYEVRAIFDYVRAVPGEDVKISGARVGTIKSLDVTKDQKAAVTLAIDKAGFTPFHSDAHCEIRAQSLIGETFVECTPGTNAKPELQRIADGQPGAGEHLLPVTNTSSPIDVDLLNDVMRRPFRERLAIIINEFGAGLAGRGADLNEVIHRANPALRETDKVLAVLAKQNRTLATLARESDQSLAPLARQRRHFAHFIVAANQTAQAAAERRNDISRSFEKLPKFLKVARPYFDDLGSFAGQAQPVMADLRRAGPSLSRFFQELKPFSEKSIPAFRTLGDASDAGRQALTAAQPTIRTLSAFANDAAPVASNLSALSNSLDKTQAIDNLMRFVLYGTTSINGFDDISHFLRAGLIVNTCATYAATQVSRGAGCSANFTPTPVVTGATAASDPVLARQSSVLRDIAGGGSGASASAPLSGKGQSLLRQLLGIAQPPSSKQDAAQRRQGIERIQKGASQPPASVDSGDPAQPLLDYLMGNDG